MSDSFLTAYLNQQAPELVKEIQQDQTDNSNLSPTAQRVLNGLPNLLTMGSGLPGPMGMINGVIKGLAEQHIGSMPEDYLQGTLAYIIAELTFWKDGPSAESATEDGSKLSDHDDDGK
jgi:hypothetical protein